MNIIQSQPFQNTPETNESRAKERIDGFLASLDPADLPSLSFQNHEMSRISDIIENQSACEHLREFNSIPNLSEVVSKVFILLKARDCVNRTILHIAIERSDVSMVKLILTMAPNLLNVKADKGMTPLAIAACSGNEEIISWLLNPEPLGIKIKVSINEKNVKGRTALHFAIHFGHPAIARKLLASGANKNALDNDGFTPADMALFRLHKHDESNNLLVVQDPLQRLKYVSMLKEFKPDNNIRDPKRIALLLGIGVPGNNVERERKVQEHKA